jgi:hypothetical protein
MLMMREPIRPNQFRLLKHALLAPQTLASAIDAGLGWKFPALVIMVIVVGLDFLALPLFMKSLAQMAPQGLSAHQMAQFQETSRVMRPIQILLTPIGLLIRWAITAVLLYAMSAALQHSPSRVTAGNPSAPKAITFKKLFVLVVYASLIPLVEVLVKNLLLWARYELDGTIVVDPPIGLDALVQSTGAAISVLLQHANVFELWFVALLIGGVATLCRTSKRSAFAIVLPVWGFWLLGHIAFAMVKEVLTRQLGT